MDNRGNNHHTSGSKNLLVSIFLNLIITLAEIAGGLLSNSLALLSDALHNLSDTFALFLAYIARKISSRSSSPQKTFGYKRIEILAALLNGIILIVISVYLFYEAINRLFNPEPVKSGIMFIVTSIGLLGNLISVLLIKKDSKKNLNIKSAYLHLLGDTFSSITVIFGSIIIYVFEVFWVDPILTFIIGVFILKETFSIIKETVDILMESTPHEISIKQIKAELEKEKGIDNIHHIHSWKITDNETHFQCHLEVKKDMLLSDANNLRNLIEKKLKKNFMLDHVTIQLEFASGHENNAIANNCS